MSVSPAPVSIPFDARIRLGHAVLQAIADDHGVEMLHIKGYATDVGLYWPGRQSSDVDLLVRPSQATRYLDALNQHGWRRVTSFRSGSIFEHAAVAWHDSWGYADVHRVIPGIGLDGEEAFNRLWNERKSSAIAEYNCPVPSRIHQALVIVLHNAREPERSRHDMEHLGSTLTPDEFEQVRGESSAFAADIAFAAATGKLDDFVDHPEHALWAAIGANATRFGLLRARMKSAPTLAGRVAVLASAALPNRDHLRMSLGREPQLRDYVADLNSRARALGTGMTNPNLTDRRSST